MLYFNSFSNYVLNIKNNKLLFIVSVAFSLTTNYLISSTIEKVYKNHSLHSCTITHFNENKKITIIKKNPVTKTIDITCEKIINNDDSTSTKFKLYRVNNGSGNNNLDDSHCIEKINLNKPSNELLKFLLKKVLLNKNSDNYELNEFSCEYHDGGHFNDKQYKNNSNFTIITVPSFFNGSKLLKKKPQIYFDYPNEYNHDKDILKLEIKYHNTDFNTGLIEYNDKKEKIINQDTVNKIKTIFKELICEKINFLRNFDNDNNTLKSNFSYSDIISEMVFKEDKKDEPLQ